MKNRLLPKCRKCGKQIAIISYGIYRKTVVDPGAVYIIPDQDGEDYVRIDGSKVRGREAEDGTLGDEPVYRMHRKTCRGRQ